MLTLIITIDEDGNLKVTNDEQGDWFDDTDTDQARRTFQLTLEIEPAKKIEMSAKIPTTPEGGTIEIKVS